MLLTPLVLLNLLSVGTVMSDGSCRNRKSCCRWIPASPAAPTSGLLALQSLQARLATGYGFASFWGSSAIQNLPEGKEWADYRLAQP